MSPHGKGQPQHQFQDVGEHTAADGSGQEPYNKRLHLQLFQVGQGEGLHQDTGGKGPAQFTGNVPQREGGFGRRDQGEPGHKADAQSPGGPWLRQTDGNGIHGDGPVGGDPAHVGADGMEDDPNGQQQGRHSHPAMGITGCFHRNQFRNRFFHAAMLLCYNTV